MTKTIGRKQNSKFVKSCPLFTNIKTRSTRAARRACWRQLLWRRGTQATATRAINAARALLGQSQGWEGRCWFGIANARVQAAVGKLAEARESLNAVIAETRKHSNLRYQLEARLALYEIEAKTDRTSARAHAEDSRTRGLWHPKALPRLIARKRARCGSLSS